jgi:hypothetical protein
MQKPAQKRAGTVYRNRLTDRLDKGLFFIAFTIGAGGIVGLKLGEWPQWIVTAFPLAIMGLYAVYVFASQGYRLREDVAGDSLYYLGFLYTLTSLAFSLYAFTQDEGSTHLIISNFGIALATTIMGMALRVFFTHMREDPLEVEREARVDLSEAVAKLKAELDRVVLELNSFRRATLQSLDEGQREIQEKVGHVVSDSTARYAQLTTDMAGYLEALHTKVSRTLAESVACYAEGGRSVAEKIEAAFAEFAKHAGELNKVAKGTVAATKRLLERVERIEAPSDLLEKKFTPAVEHVLTGMQQSLVTYNEMYAPQLEALIASMQQACAGTTAHTAQTTLMQRLLASVVQSAQTLEEQLTAWRSKDEQQTAAIGREVDLLHHTLVAFRREVDKNGHILSEVAKEVEAELGTARGHRQALEAELETSRQLVGNMHASLVSMTSLIVEKLHGS